MASTQLLHTRTGIAFLTPALLFVAVFLLLPFAWIVAMSFTSQTLLGANAEGAFVGFRNYLALFDAGTWLPGNFGHSLIVTAIFTIGSIIGQVGLGVTLALLFFQKRGPWREVVFTLVTLCWILPEVPIAFGWLSFLDRDFGTLNGLLKAVSLPARDWLLDQPLLSIIIFNTWRGTAFAMLLFSAALASIPPSFLEAAQVSGASKAQQLRDIIVPQITPQFLTALVLITLGTLNTFTPYLLTAGGPLNKTDLVSIHAYNVAFKYGEWGKGTAIAMIMMCFNMALVFVYLAALRRQRHA